MNIELDIERFSGSDGQEREWVTLKAYKELQGELQALRKDADEMRKNGARIDAQVQDQERIYQDRLDMKEQLDELAKFIGEHYKREIDLGQHRIFKTAVDAAIYYLGRERMQKNER